jgi:hypothetical protein
MPTTILGWVWAALRDYPSARFVLTLPRRLRSW